jgi:hypothetical protein
MTSNSIVLRLFIYVTQPRSCCPEAVPHRLCNYQGSCRAVRGQVTGQRAGSGAGLALSGAAFMHTLASVFFCMHYAVSVYWDKGYLRCVILFFAWYCYLFIIRLSTERLYCVPCRSIFMSTTACSRNLLQKLLVVQLVKKSPIFYGAHRLTVVLTRARHWTPSWATETLSKFPVLYSC